MNAADQVRRNVMARVLFILESEDGEDLTDEKVAVYIAMFAIAFHEQRGGAPESVYLSLGRAIDAAYQTTTYSDSQELAS